MTFKQSKKFIPAVLGLDLSTTSTGWAYLSWNDPLALMPYGKIEAKQEDPDDRIDTITDILVKDVIKAYGIPAYLCLEQVNSFVNANTVRANNQLVGAIKRECRKLGVAPFEMNTSHAKKVFCGKFIGGVEGKELTVKKASELFGITFTMKSNDICDAIQVAYAYRQDLKGSEGSELK